MSDFRHYVSFALLASACAALSGCATNKGLPSDQPFALSQYNAGQNDTTTGGKTSAADLVTPPPPTPGAASTPSAPTSMPVSAPLKFDVTCVDDIDGKTYKSGEAGYEPCLRRKAQGTPRR